MFLATTNKLRQLLHLSYIGHVGVQEIRNCRKTLATLMADLPAGFHLLMDLDRLDSMDVKCAPEIGKIMEICDQNGVGQIIRVIPDPKKDIGFHLMYLFHYPSRPPVRVCESLAEADKLLPP